MDASWKEQASNCRHAMFVFGRLHAPFRICGTCVLVCIHNLYICKEIFMSLKLLYKKANSIGAA